MRVTPAFVLVPLAPVGITPAHAGNTALFARSEFFPGDHPRSCGEHDKYERSLIRPWGSPPLMRGTQLLRCNCIQSSGITPAHAGNTFRISPVSMWPWDHPRSCGEHKACRQCTISLPGSPPLMRGTPCIDCVRVLDLGITPAHAGNTVGKFLIR